MTDPQKDLLERELKAIFEKYHVKNIKIEWLTGETQIKLKIESVFKKN